MKDKKLDQVGEFFFDEKTESLHQMTQTGFDSAQWRNLDEEIDKKFENVKPRNSSGTLRF